MADTKDMAANGGQDDDIVIVDDSASPVAPLPPESDLSETAPVDDEIEAKRSRRRAERREFKERRRQRMDESRNLIRQQAQQISSLQQQVQQLAQRTSGQEVTQADSGLAAANAALNDAKRRLIEAKQAGDAAGEVAAMEAFNHATGQVQAWANYKQQLIQATQNKTAPAPKADNLNRERAQRFYDRFCDDNDWFDSKGGDKNSAAALKVSAELEEEGYMLDSPEHWRRLRKKLAKVVSVRDEDEDDSDDEDDDDDEPVQKKRAPVTGSGKRSPATASSSRGVPASVVAIWKEHKQWPDDKAAQRRMVQDYLAAAAKYKV